MPALGPVVARDGLLLRALLEVFGEPLRRDAELLGDALGAHRSVLSGGGDEVDRHQPVIRPLGESQHACPLYPTFYARLSMPPSISDPQGLRPVRSYSATRGAPCQGDRDFGRWGLALRRSHQGARLRARCRGTALRPPRAGGR